MSEFYMVWVAGRGAPKFVYDNFEGAAERAEFMRSELTDRAVYVLAPVAVAAGRPIAQIRSGMGCRAQKVENVENPVVVLKKRRIPVIPE